jgi:molybdenum cofactor guanylyltransferase/molybdopterin-guanine dinucleotide biosynthesis protein MobB
VSFTSDAVVGCILAGGQSSRMGGGDKGLKPLAGRSMLARVVDRLGAQTVALVLNANGDPARFADTGLPVVPDSVAGFAGPLAGVLAGLDWAAAHHPDAAFVATAAADTPFFPEVLVEALLDEAGSPHTVVLAASDEGRHPVFGLWPVALRDDLRVFLEKGETRKVLAWVDRHRNAVVKFPPLRAGDRLVDPFFNVNTPAELAEAEAIAAELEGEGAPPVQVRRSGPVVFGVAGWKNSGKTTLVTKLVAEFVRRGFRVATVKHAHHDADVDRPGTDSHAHRLAGASQTALVSTRRMAVMSEFAGPDEEPRLAEVLKRLNPADVVIVEGYKRAELPKIEARRLASAGSEPLHPADAHVVAIAADAPQPGATVPVLDIDDPAAVADFVSARFGLPTERSR